MTPLDRLFRKRAEARDLIAHYERELAPWREYDEKLSHELERLLFEVEEK